LGIYVLATGLVIMHLFLFLHLVHVQLAVSTKSIFKTYFWASQRCAESPAIIHK